MSGGEVAKLFIVEFHTRGWVVGVSHTPEERVLTTFFRLSREQRNKLNYLRVKFYRLLARHKVFMLGGKYVVPLRALPLIEEEFQKIYKEFTVLRREFYDDITKRWDRILPQMKEIALRLGIPTMKLERLKPSSEEFIDAYYTITPLPNLISQIYRTYEDFMRMAEEKEEYRRLAERVKAEAERMISEIKEEYEKRLEEMEKLVEKLKGELRARERKLYKARLAGMLRDTEETASDVADLLGEETAEELYERLNAIKEVLTEV